MEIVERIKKFEEFIELEYKADFAKFKREKLGYLIVDFKKLEKFSPDLSEAFLEDPEDSFAAAEETGNHKIKFRFINLPKSSAVKVNNIRSKHLHKFSVFEGIVKQLSPVMPAVTFSKFECPNCGAIINMIAVGEEIIEPSRCGCGRKGKLRLIERSFQDLQGILLEEIFEQLEAGEQPRSIKVFIKNDLTDPDKQYRILPGKKIKINGVLMERALSANNGKILTKFDFYIDTNNIESVEEKEEIKITKQDEKIIKKLSKDPELIEKLLQSFAPATYGMREIQQGMIYAIIGGNEKKDADEKTRRDIHLLLAGEPGLNKSKLLLQVNTLVPKGRIISGKGTSAAGLGAAAVKDELIGGWTLEAGAAVLANKGILFIDEFDKMNENDRATFHEVMEQQTCKIDKATIHTTLQAETTIIAACNPKHAKFNDTEENFSKQLNLPSSLLNRFDLIFKLRDIPNKEKDRNLARHVFKVMKKIEVPLQKDLIKKYFYYARHNTNPSWTKEAEDICVEWYEEVRSKYNPNALPLNPRQLQVLIRLSEADAKLHLSKTIQPDNVKAAKKLLEYSLKQIRCIDESGNVQMDNLSSDLLAKEREVLDLIREKKSINIEELRVHFGFDHNKVFVIIGKLRKLGDIFECRPGEYKAI